jgi:1,4-dihydroxy-2-naphthoyl-CoA synthase
VPKPVIAAVNGLAIGGGHVPHVLCDLSIAADHAKSAEQAERWGLVNKVVPGPELMPAAKAWINQLAQYSPTAIRFLKHSFNADTDHQGGLSQLSQAALDVFAGTEEAREGTAAFAEKRKPDFTAHQVKH